MRPSGFNEEFLIAAAETRQQSVRFETSEDEKIKMMMTTKTTTMVIRK